MDDLLIMLELTREDVSYAPESLREELNRLFEGEWTMDDKLFKANLHKLLCDGMVDMIGGALKLTSKGNAELRHNKIIAFIQGRMATLLKS